MVTKGRIVASVTLLTLAAGALTGTPVAAAELEEWALRNENSAGPAQLTLPWIFGSRLACDADGDGQDSPASYDARNGTFFLSDAAYPIVEFGPQKKFTFPVCGDWDGDGRDGIGVVRANRQGEWKWRLRNDASSGSADCRFTFLRHSEGVEYEHLAGDWNGDGVDTPGMWHSTGYWYLRNHNSSGPADKVFRHGRGRYPVVGDWDGNGRVTVGTYRGSDQMWFLRNRNRSGKARHVFHYGDIDDFGTVAGDWDGDGDDTVGVIRSLR